MPYRSSADLPFGTSIWIADQVSSALFARISTNSTSNCSAAQASLSYELVIWNASSPHYMIARISLYGGERLWRMQV
jgi:hypothetical protein